MDLHTDGNKRRLALAAQGIPGTDVFCGILMKCDDNFGNPFTPYLKDLVRDCRHGYVFSFFSFFSSFSVETPSR